MSSCLHTKAASTNRTAVLDGLGLQQLLRPVTGTIRLFLTFMIT